MRKTDIVVGVNRFNDGDAQSLAVFALDPSVEHDQVERVRAVRAGRSASECRSALAAVEQAARTGDNLVPVVIEAIEKKATLGEISDALRRVFGEYQDASSA